MPNGKLEVKIISPSQILYEGPANALSFPGLRGQAQILDRHARMTSLIGRGRLFISGPDKQIEIERGIIFVDRNKVRGLVRLKAKVKILP